MQEDQASTQDDVAATDGQIASERRRPIAPAAVEPANVSRETGKSEEVSAPASSGEESAVPADVPDAPDADAPVAAPAGFRARRKAKAANRTKLPGRDPIWAKSLIVFGAVIVLLATTAVVGTQILASRYSGSVNQKTLLGENSRAGDPAEVKHNDIKGPLNFLLLGSDQRALDPEDGQRSDSIIIVHIPASLDRAYLLSIPRDLRVKIPAFAPTAFKGVSHEKINGAFQYGGGGEGGVQLLAETLTGLLGIRFDGAAIVNFDGFKSAVDLLGGVDMCIDQRVVSIHLGYDDKGNYLDPSKGGHPAVYEAGCHHLESWQALDLVRQRKSLANGDYDRQKNQQKFIRAMLNKAQSKDLTTNPIALDKFIRVIGSALTVDTNGISIADLMFGLRNVSPSNLLGLQVPSEPQDIGGISYVVPLNEAESLYTAMRGDLLDSWAVENPTWVNRM